MNWNYYYNHKNYIVERKKIIDCCFLNWNLSTVCHPVFNDGIKLRKWKEIVQKTLCGNNNFITLTVQIIIFSFSFWLFFRNFLMVLNCVLTRQNRIGVRQNVCVLTVCECECQIVNFTLKAYGRVLAFTSYYRTRIQLFHNRPGFPLSLSLSIPSESLLCTINVRSSFIKIKSGYFKNDRLRKL